MNIVIKPKLSTIAPLTDALVVMFIWLNPLIGWSIIVQAPNPTMIVINSYALSYVWAGLFFILSAILLYGKLTNNWTLLKRTLAAGLFTKAVFTYALVVLGVKHGFNSVVGVLALWVSITWVQFFTVKHFKIPGGRYAK